MPHGEKNKGPNAGGTYANENNHLVNGGEVKPNEAHSMTGGTMAYILSNVQEGSAYDASESAAKEG